MASTEIVTESEELEMVPPPIVADSPPADKEKERKSKKREKEEATDLLSTEDKEAPLKQVSPTLQKIRAEEDAGLKEMLDDIGPDGSFKVVIRRREPKEVRHPATGKMVKVDGYIETVEKRIDEDYILRKHGGGEYQIKIHKRDARGSMNIIAHRSITIAGEPNLDNLPQTPVPAQPGAPAHASGEPEGVVKKAFEIMADQLNAARSSGGASEELTHLLDFLKTTISNKDSELAAIRAEMAAMRNAPRPDDSFKETMIKSFVQDDGARTQAVRLSYEAEIRALKEGFEQERARLADRAERDRKEISDRAERDLQRVVDAKNAEIAAIKSSAEQGRESLKVAHETQITVYKSETSKLERENKELREELKDLRKIKDKPLIEQIKDIKTMKEALSDGDDDEEEKSTIEKIVEAIPSVPAAVQAARGMFNQGQQPQQAPPQKPAVQSKRQIFADAHGNKFTIVNGVIQPLKRKDAPPPPGAIPGQPQLPPVDPAQMKMAVAYLENAFSNNTDPKVIAQSGRTHMSESMMVAIRELGVEQFLIKIGGVQMASPLLSSLKGKNWIRTVGKELIGEE